MDNGALLERIRQLRAGSSSPRTRALVFGIALVLFAGTFVFAVRAMPPVEEIRWGWFIVVAVLGYPLMLFWMSTQYRLSAAFLGERVGVLEALRVAVLSAAANLLPLPGSVLVRSEALYRRGASTGRAVGASALVGLSWLGASAVLAAIALAASDAGAATAIIAAVVAGVALGAFGLGCRRLGVGQPVAFQAIAVGFAIAATTAINLSFVLAGLNIEADIGQTVAVSSSGVLAATVGFFPGGLGLRELFAAGLAAATGIDAEAGALSVLVTRAIAMIVLFSVSAFLVATARRDETPNASPPASPSLKGP